MMFDPYAPWYQHSVCVIDCETTGVDVHDRIIQLGLARFERGKLVDSWSGLVWAGVEIPEEAEKIHGISTAQIASAPPFVATLPHILRLCRDAYPAAYNASFDKRMLMSELKRLAVRMHELPRVAAFDPSLRWLDPLAWVRHIDRFVKGGNKLPQVCMRYGIALRQAHDACSDAVAAGEILWHLRTEIGDMTLTEMLRQQEIHAEAFERRMSAWRARQQRA